MSANTQNTILPLVSLWV